MTSLQSNIKQEEHNCIKSLVKSIKSSCTKPTKLAGHCLYEGDHPQLGLSMNLEAWKEQEETQGSLPASIRQNRTLILYRQTTEQVEYQSVGQPTLRTMEHPTWCTYERGNPRDVIFGQERRGQDSELARRVLTEPTRSAPRSRVRQIFDND